MSTTVFDDGVKLFNDGHFADSLTRFQEHLLQEPTHIAARTYLGAAHGKMGNFSAAAEEFLTLTKLDPANARHCCNLGAAYEECGLDVLAAGAYTKALQIEPGNQKANQQLVVLNARQQTIAETQVAAPQQVTTNEPHNRHSSRRSISHKWLSIRFMHS